MAGAAFCALVSIVLMAWLARHLGPAVFGEFTALTALASLALVGIEGGWPTLVQREGAASSSGAEAEHVLAARAVAYIVATSLGAAALALAIGASGRASPALAAAMVCMGAVALMNLVSARMRARGRFGLEAAWQSAARVVSAAAIVAALLVLQSRSPALVFAAWTAGLLLLAAFAAPRWIPRPIRPRTAMHYGGALWFAAMAALVLFVQKADLLVLAAQGVAHEELAFYAAGTRVTEAGLLLFAPFVNVALRLLRQRAHSREAFAALVSPLLAVALAVGLAGWGATWVAGAPIVALLFGPDYAGAEGVIRWIAAMLPFACATLVLVTALTARNRERAAMLALLAAAIALVIAVAAGYRLHGTSGAAIGAAAAHAIAAALCGAALWRDLRRA